MNEYYCTECHCNDFMAISRITFKDGEASNEIIKFRCADCGQDVNTEDIRPE